MARKTLQAAQELAQNRKLREQVTTAVASVLAARRRLMASFGLAGLVWRVGHDHELQSQLRRFTEAVGDIAKRTEKVRARQRRRRRILAGAAGVTGSLGAAALYTARRKRSRLGQQPGEVPPKTPGEVPPKTVDSSPQSARN